MDGTIHEIRLNFLEDNILALLIATARFFAQQRTDIGLSEGGTRLKRFKLYAYTALSGVNIHRCCRIVVFESLFRM